MFEDLLIIPDWFLGRVATNTTPNIQDAVDFNSLSIGDRVVHKYHGVGSFSGVYNFGSTLVDNKLYIIGGNQTYLDDPAKKNLDDVGNYPESTFDDFLDKINQSPIPEKIIKIELKRNDCLIVGVACSATESTKGSVVVKNGLIAFRYLKVGKGKRFDSSFIITKNDPITIIESNKNKLFLSLLLSLLIF